MNAAPSSAPDCIVFIHGWASTSAIWQPLIAHLKTQQSASPLPVKCIELPGLSKQSGDNFSDIASYLEFLAAHIPPNALIVGWSLGGLLAIESLRSAERFKSLNIYGVLTLATNLRFVESSDYPYAMKTEVFEKFYRSFQKNSEATLKQFYGLQVLGDKNKRSVLNSLRRFGFAENLDPASKEILDKQLLMLAENSVNLPTLSKDGLAKKLTMVFGKEDSLVPASAADSAKQFVEDYVLDSVAHCIPLSAPEKVADIITAIIERRRPTNE